jgi:hypothetical protein
MSDIEFSEACDELVKEINKKEHYVESYGLMLMVFFDSKENDETNRMAVSLAKDAIRDGGDPCLNGS